MISFVIQLMRCMYAVCKVLYQSAFVYKRLVKFKFVIKSLRVGFARFKTVTNVFNLLMLFLLCFNSSDNFYVAF